MIQVQSVCILFPVAKYWLSSMAADGQNGEHRLCWKEWASVRVTSGPSWAQWTWSLHQAASLELAGAFGAFCHSSHCSCAQHPIPHLPQCQERGSMYSVVSAGFVHPTALSAFCWAHLYVPCARETYEVAAVQNVCIHQPPTLNETSGMCLIDLFWKYTYFIILINTHLTCLQPSHLAAAAHPVFQSCDTNTNTATDTTRVATNGCTNFSVIQFNL